MGTGCRTTYSELRRQSSRKYLSTTIAILSTFVLYLLTLSAPLFHIYKHTNVQVSSDAAILLNQGHRGR